ncbi:MAG TPA: phosphate signaling complex protein PhoU [Chitinophagaceae bacterium]|nr:phosphate signaling complex protein PhoU [Chitinophagaceae bacterium]
MIQPKNKLTHLDNELHKLKAESIKMWALVLKQLHKSRTSLVNIDKDLAREVILSEKRVNAFELKIDRDCEDIFALFTPVAVDLRFLLAVLKINMNLERTGDNAETIAQSVVDLPAHFDRKLLEITRVVEMFDQANIMISDVMHAFDKEDTLIARKTFKKDDLLDEINDNSTAIITEYIASNLDKNLTGQALYIYSIIRKLERVGDQAKNIAEEIIFYSEAKVLKHQPKGKKSGLDE